MIEETARVVTSEGEYAWVETQRRSSCGSCSAKGCGTGALAKVIGQRVQRLKALNRMGAAEGDTVIVGIREDALVRGSAAVYLVPLLAMLAGALLGETMAGQLGSDSEVVSIVFGMLGFLAGLFWLRWFNRRVSRDERYQALILRRADANPLFSNIPIQREQ